MTESPTCRTCRYWAAEEPTNERMHGTRPCLVLSPRRVWKYDLGPDGVLNSFWPYTAPDAWCGEHHQFNKDKP